MTTPSQGGPARRVADRLADSLGFGVSDEAREAARRIVELADAGGPREGFLSRLEEGVRSSAAPRRAVLGLARFLECRADAAEQVRMWEARPATLTLLLHAFAVSRHLEDLIVGSPAHYAALCAPGALSHARSDGDLDGELGGLLEDVPDFQGRLGVVRRYRCREMVRIAVRDVMGATDPWESAAEISALADVCLRTLYQTVLGSAEHEWGVLEPDRDATVGMAVIALGKLGGDELNYSSDVDLLFVYEGYGETAGGVRAGRLSAHEFFNRTATSFVQAATARSADGWLYRVDTRLRPEGEGGPLAQPLAACEAYYGGRADTWERLALTKAKYCAGDRSVADSFLAIAEGFVYGPFGVDRLVSDVAAVRRRIEDELVEGPEGERNIKLGRGGIREIEFIVQTLLIVHGRERHSMRCRATGDGLVRLGEEGVLDKGTVSALLEAYWFLRRLEQRIQMENELQTHEVPEVAESLDRLSRGLGYSARGAFEDDLRKHRERVREIYAGIFPVRRVVASPLAQMVEEHRTDRLSEWLAARGFPKGRRSAEAILALAHGTGGIHVSRATTERLIGLLPSLLETAGELGEPGRALVGLERLVERYGARSAILELLATQPKILQILLDLFDRSRALTDIVIGRPELMEGLILEGQFGSRKPSVLFRRELKEALRGAADVEEAMDRARRYRAEEFLRIGLSDLLGVGESPALTSELSDLADAAVRQGIVWGGGGGAGEIAVLALGKAGGREIGYGADLDVVFLSAGPPEGREGRLKAAARLIDFMGRQTDSGRLFALDPRLRPYGADGPLVADLGAFEAYHRETAQLWERQALVKARMVCGPPDLVERATHLVEDLAYAPGLDAEGVRSIREMRSRIERERVKPGAEDRSFKTGAGGLIDIEFLAQTLQLKHGSGESALRQPSTIEALDACGGLGLVPAREASDLKDAYAFLRRVEGAVRIEDDASGSELPSLDGRLLAVARGLGYRSSAELTSDLGARRTEVRAIYEAAFDALESV